MGIYFSPPPHLLCLATGASSVPRKRATAVLGKPAECVMRVKQSHFKSQCNTKTKTSHCFICCCFDNDDGGVDAMAAKTKTTLNPNFTQLGPVSLPPPPYVWTPSSKTTTPKGEE